MLFWGVAGKLHLFKNVFSILSSDRAGKNVSFKFSSGKKLHTILLLLYQMKCETGTAWFLQVPWGL